MEIRNQKSEISSEPNAAEVSYLVKRIETLLDRAAEKQSRATYRLVCQCVRESATRRCLAIKGNF